MNKKLIRILIIILILSLAFVTYQLIGLRNEIDSLNSQWGESQRVSRSIMDELKADMNLLASGTNQLRMQNGLSPLILEEPSDDSQTDEELDPELIKEKRKEVFYTALDYLLSINEQYKLKGNFEENYLSSPVRDYLTDNGLTLSFFSLLEGEIAGDDSSILSFSITQKGVSCTDYWGREYDEVGEDDFLLLIVDHFDRKAKIKAKVEVVKQNMRNLMTSDKFKELIDEKELKIKFEQDRESYIMLIRLSDYVVKERGGISYESGKLFLGEEEFETWDQFEEKLYQYLNRLDGRTDREIRDQEMRELITHVLGDESFTRYLDQWGVRLSPELRMSEDSDYINWDFLDEDDNPLGSFALLEGTGELYLLDGEDVMLRSFRNFSETHGNILSDSAWHGEKVENIDFISTTNQEETYLVVGSHEKNADTIILIHTNKKTREMDMISIPRDLWFKNRKLNSVYRYYGIDALAKDISDLTGLSIDKYMAIDMYAFIDVINIMGGIDIVLDEPLIDPTYHIKENGTWSTLSYPAGPVHLDGLGALRVVRSRHSTNDYSRSRRQQLVINGIFEKLTNMGMADVDDLLEFVKAGMKYTETNMTVGNLVMDLMTFKDGHLRSKNVIDSTNVLYESYSNLYRLSPEEQKKALENDDFYLGAWIVLPKEENYNLIKWHIKEIIKP